MAKPEIRLKGFEGEWRNHKIGELSDILTGYPFEGSSIKKEGKYLLMRGINITEGFIRHSEDIDRYYDGDIFSLKKYELKTNDLVIGMDGSKVGKNSALVTEREKGSLLVQRVARLRNSNVNINRIIQIALRSVKFIRYVEEIKTSSAIPHISPSDIYNFEITLSDNTSEQKSIADYFMSLDSMIQGVTKKIASLKQMKQACLVSMFPQAGETTPRVRFKGFKGEWGKNKAGNLFMTFNERNRPDLPVLSANQDIRGMAPRTDTGYNISHNKANEVTYKVVKPGQYVIHLRSFQGGFAHSSVEGITSPAYTVFGFKDAERHDDYFWKIIFM